MEKIEKNNTLKELVKKQERQRKRQIFIENAVMFFGMVAVAGFVMSLALMMNMAVEGRITGQVIGIGEGNLYGLIIVMFISLVFSLSVVLWFRKNVIEKRHEKSIREILRES